MKGSTGPLAPVTAARLKRAPLIDRVAGRNGTKADILVRSLDGEALAVKDYRPRNFAIRHTLGRLLIGRETRAYRTAGRVEGLACFRGRVDAFALATRWLPGRTLRQIVPGDQPPELADALAGTISTLHERGVALADLHLRDVIVGDDGSFVIVDLAAAWVAAPGCGRVRRAIFERLRAQDLLALERIRARLRGLDADDGLGRADPAAVLRFRRARRLKRGLDLLRRRGR